MLFLREIFSVIGGREKIYIAEIEANKKEFFAVADKKCHSFFA